MEIQGKIIQVLPLQQGTSKAGNPWKKQEYVLETMDTYPRKVKFDFFGDKADQFPLNIGETVTVSYDLESREFNGRWYTDVRAWKAEKSAPQVGTNVSEPAPQPYAQPATNVNPFDMPASDASDDLPF